MSTEIDFKSLWGREKASAPDVSEILAKANRLNNCSRRKIWICNIGLSITIIVVAMIWWHLHPRLITTKIGLTLMICAMVIFIITTNQLSPLLAKADMQTDTNTFLSQMIRIKHKQEFINKTITTIYFLMLSVGLGLYFIEYISRGNWVFQLCVYGITIAFLAINWFYINARSVRKQRKAINEIIVKLEEVNRQMGSGT
ncbi:MAG: hypothetical protein ACTHMI_08115 [Mucilaginibacter sp.]